MVAINIQSADDIISAYLKYLKFSDKQARKIAATIKESVAEQHDIVQAIDNLLIPQARAIFSGMYLTDEQLAALYKFCFLQAGGAKKWGGDFFKQEPSPAFAEALRKEVMLNAPGYQMSHMRQQKIEPVLRHHFKLKFWHFKGSKNG